MVRLQRGLHALSYCPIRSLGSLRGPVIVVHMLITPFACITHVLVVIAQAEGLEPAPFRLHRRHRGADDRVPLRIEYQHSISIFGLAKQPPDGGHSRPHRHPAQVGVASQSVGRCPRRRQGVVAALARIASKSTVLAAVRPAGLAGGGAIRWTRYARTSGRGGPATLPGIPAAVIRRHGVGRRPGFLAPRLALPSPGMEACLDATER